MAGFLSLDNGLTGILSSRRAIDVISQNVANASNPDYSRQQVHLTSNRPLTIGNMSVGTGVSVENITQARDALMDRRFLQENKNLGEYDQLMEVYREIENALNEPSDEGIRGSLSSFVSSMQNLANEPENRGSRRDVVGQAQTLSNVIQRFHRSLRAISGGPSSAVDSQIKTTLDNINNIGKQIASINIEINTAEAGGTTPNDLLDQRRKLINELSEYANVTEERGLSTHRVNVGGYTLVQGGNAHEFSFERPRGSEEYKIIYDDHSQSIVKPGGGRLKALMDLKEDRVPGLVDKLNDITVQFTDRFNDIHRSGFGLDGSTGSDFWAELPTSGEGIYRLEGLSSSGSIADQRAGFITDPDIPLIGDSDSEPKNFEGDAGVYAVDNLDESLGTYKGTLEINGRTINYDMSVDSANDIIDKINESNNQASAYLSSNNRLVITGEQSNDYEIDTLRDTGLLLEKANILTVGGTDRTSLNRVDDSAAELIQTEALNLDAAAGTDSIEVDGAEEHFSVGDHILISDDNSSESAIIQDITGDQITLRNNLDNGYTMADNATMGEITLLNAINDSGTDLAQGTLEFVSSNSDDFSINYDARQDSLGDIVERINTAANNSNSNIAAEVTTDNRLRIFASQAPPDAAVDPAATENPDASFKVNDTASQQIDSDVAAGLDIEIEVNDVSKFNEGDRITISDTNGEETATITDIDPDAGTIRVDELAGNYQTADNAAVRGAGEKHDKRNLLTTLGMHRLYNANDPSTEMALKGASRRPPRADQVAGLEVDQRIDNNPNLIAAAGGVDQNLTGVNDVSLGAGDGSNAYELSNLTKEPIMQSNSNSTDDFISSMVAGIGNEASLVYREQASSQNMVHQIQDQIRSVSSVSLDEEMTNMLRFQQSYQASARVISVAREMANAVFQLI